MQNTMLIPLLASLLAFGSVLLLGFGVLGARREAGRALRVRAKVAGFAGVNDTAAPAGSPLVQLAGLLAGVVRGLGARLGPKDLDSLDKTKLDLIRAGLRGPNAVQSFHGAKAALMLLPPSLFLGVAWILPQAPSAQVTIIGALALACLGTLAPGVWLRRRMAARRLALLCELPDALDLLVVCVESGMGLDQAIHRVSEELRESAPVISGELRTLTLEMRAGRQRQQALKDLAERTGIEDVQSLVTLLVQADTFGISVARTLRVYSDTLRTSRFQRAEETAAKLPTKLMFPLVLCIFPVLFVVLIGPAVLQLAHVFARMGQ
ncbi:MAG: type II secretion system F family protein [Humidesulfovibrio sp.]|nr:type II secretion system F family protein [Humidesulfovibrio sp.]PKN09992.1 MAG: type II secretion protein F [Deltaproteobacteria bacterium HGW-Deltaproteobacteria-8]